MNKRAYVVDVAVLYEADENKFKSMLLWEQYGDLFFFKRTAADVGSAMIERMAHAFNFEYWIISPYPRGDMREEIYYANGDLLILTELEQVISLSNIYKEIGFCSNNESDNNAARENGISLFSLDQIA